MRPLFLGEEYMDNFLLGSSYYPEWWDESEWEKDFYEMEKLGLNCVRMGEFAWSWFEPEEGKFNFEPMKRAMDCAMKHNIKVILGTVTAVCPAWLYKKYPSVKGGNKNGDYDFGGRKGQCLSDKHFLEYAERITEKEAQALGSHPALIGWQLDNEPGFPFHDFDSECNRVFKEFLKNKYGEIDKLNDAWFTMEWSNKYNSFDEIDIPVNSCEGGWTLQIQLDYRKFFSRNFHNLLSMEARIVRKYSKNRFLYTNWPGANWSVKCYEGCEYLDYSAWDNYVGQPNGENYRIQLRAAMEHAFNRRLDSKERRRFLVAEQKCYTDINTLPEVISAQTWLNIAYGAFGTVYFEWRAPLGGAEQDYGSLTAEDANVREDTADVFKKLSKDILRIYPEISGAKTKSDIGAVYSYENSWGTRDWVVDGFYDEEFFNIYGGFQNALKTNIDVCSIEDDLSNYKLLLMPNHRIITDEQKNKLEKYVRDGGTLLINTSCGTRDEFNKTRVMLKPGMLADIAGAVVSGEITADEFKKQTGIDCTVKFDDSERVVTSVIHRLKLKSAEKIASFAGGKLDGLPAVTVNNYGKGKCILYACDGNDVYFYEALAHLVNGQCGIKPLVSMAENGILLASRHTDEYEYLFAVNMKERELTFKTDGYSFDVINSAEVSDSVSLKGYETAVLRREIQ